MEAQFFFFGGGFEGDGASIKAIFATTSSGTFSKCVCFCGDGAFFFGMP
jgi:hypothetical protein